jgi:hypothetical protein
MSWRELLGITQLARQFIADQGTHAVAKESEWLVQIGPKYGDEHLHKERKVVKRRFS